MTKKERFFDYIKKGELVWCFLLGFVLNLIIETLARKGTAGFEFLAAHPVVFLYNALIIAATLSVALIFKRRVFFIIVISAVWLMIGTANGVILIERMTPFTVKDLSAITDAATILTNYFNKFKLAMIATGVIIGTAGVTLIWIKSPKTNRNLAKSVVKVALMIILMFVSTAGLVRRGTLATFFGNLAYAYRDYGVPYCFSNTWLNTGIKKTPEYSSEAVRSLMPDVMPAKEGNSTLLQEEPKGTEPNVIVLQLESFTDPELFNKIKTANDAIPNFRALSNEFSSGYLTVPACGAGTANTEFEISTGLSIKFFGPGEYPFKAVLKNRPAESIAFALKSIGYKTHAIHNHRALFYNRNKVFANIGYDNFTSVEYMHDVPKTPKNWAKDKILTEYIMKTLKSTDEKDYIYTISVQGHGKYPPESLVKNPDVEISEAPTEELKWKYEYYYQQLYEMDLFVKDLINNLKKLDEPTVLVIFGDHIPALDVTADSYDRSLFETPYVIWDNMGLQKIDANMQAYELMSEVFNRIGIHKGTVVTYNQRMNHGSQEYLEGLKVLAYDMLYGKGYIYGGTNPFHKTDLKMGVNRVKIEKVAVVGGKYYIKGNNFTEYSKVTLNGEPLKTTYLSPTLLVLEEEVDPDDAASMKVSQIDNSSKEIISSTE